MAHCHHIIVTVTTACRNCGRRRGYCRCERFRRCRCGIHEAIVSCGLRCNQVAAVIVAYVIVVGLLSGLWLS
jgi:hypothetical protein